MPPELSMTAIIERLEAQIELHREREAFHAEKEAHHREQRASHAAAPASHSWGSSLEPQLGIEHSGRIGTRVPQALGLFKDGGRLLQLARDP